MTSTHPIRIVSTPTQHDRSEWARLARDAYRIGLTNTGHRFSVAAAHLGDMDPFRFDALQDEYRQWLIAGFPGYPHETLRARGR